MSNIQNLKRINTNHKHLVKEFNLQGMGIGYKQVEGKKTDDLSITFFVEKKLKISEIPLGKLLPTTLDGVKCDVVEIGHVVANTYTANVRPILGGYSVGHPDVTAGTIATIVYKGGVRHILSNNHILANVNMANIGDDIYQPGPIDGGTVVDTVAHLTDYAVLQDYCSVDCAIAEIINDGIATDVGVWGSAITGYTTPALMMTVYKSGRTTEETNNVILYTHAYVSVDYGIAVYMIADCFLTYVMSSGGDSGSLARTDATTAVGLLFAGSGTFSIFNDIYNVLSIMQVAFTNVPPPPPPPPPPVPVPMVENVDTSLKFDYIFYPGVSACNKITLTNDTGADITPHIYFDSNIVDPIWWKTLRVYPNCSGVLPSGVIDTYWEDVIPASGTQDLYIRSICTKEGFSWKYEGSYWTNTGFAIVDMDAINDNEEQSVAIDCDAANAGSTLVLDTLTTLPAGTRIAEDFVRIKFSFDGTVNAVFDIQYSDDNVIWNTVYTGADISARGVRYQMTFWWNSVGAHRYWRIEKTNAATGGANITEVQWLLFEAHQEAYDFGVYGDHSCTMKDLTGFFADATISSSVMVNIDVFARQNYMKPIGKVGKRTNIMMRNFETFGETVQVYYIPTMTMQANLNSKSDFQLEKRIWDVKAMITPQKRNLTYTADTSALQPLLYRYDQRTILLPPYGPDKVGWYMTNYDWWHEYGFTYYVLFDNHCYKIDDPQPIYIDNELIAFSARMFLQSDMVALVAPYNPRNYVLTNKDGLFQQFPIGGYLVSQPTDWLDINTPEQRPIRWAGTLPSYMFSRPLHYTNRPDTYSLVGIDSGDDGYPNGEMYITQEWNSPQTNNFQTSNAVAFGTRADAGTSNAKYFQMPRFYNWIGYVDYNGTYDIFNCLVQLYLDEDCTIPVKMNLETTGLLTKVEHAFNVAYITNTGLVTLTALGTTIYTDGHLTRTPSKLYVRYIPEDNHVGYYYP